MINDRLLKEFFDAKRWEDALNHALDKNVFMADIYALSTDKVRQDMLKKMVAGMYQIAPPHVVEIPKDEIDPNTGKPKMREVYVNFPEHRVWLHIANSILFDTCHDFIHPRCKSYLKGTGYIKVVKEISKSLKRSKSNIVGFKADLRKYFDSVPIEFIDRAFDRVEERFGHSCVVDVLRKYYHSDLYFDKDENLASKYQSLKQGCSVASWLANVVLYDIDEHLSKMGTYVRYSDDILFIGDNYKEAMEYLEDALAKMGLSLNPKKVEYLEDGKWFKFLGFMLNRGKVTMCEKSLKMFLNEIFSRTIKSKKSFDKALVSVMEWLYVGNGEYCWATGMLSALNVKDDILTLNNITMDALRAVYTGKKDIGGVGFILTDPDKCLSRGKGANVRENIRKMPRIEGFKPLGDMKNKMGYCSFVFHTSALAI